MRILSKEPIMTREEFKRYLLFYKIENQHDRIIVTNPSGDYFYIVTNLDYDYLKNIKGVRDRESYINNILSYYTA